MSLVVQGTDFLQMPSGTTAQRPASPSTGMQRYNTTLGYTEVYNGSNWVGMSTQGAVDYNTTTISNTSTLTGNLFTAGTRVLGNTYTNTSGKPRVVYIAGGNPSNGYATVSINGNIVMNINVYGQPAGTCFIVPNGATYSVAGAITLTNWYEFS